MSKSLYECHIEVVKLLEEKGETVLQPIHREPWMKEGKVPDIYVKGETYPSKDFIIGSAVLEKDGTISLHGEFLSWICKGFKLEDLGLCDPVLFYELGDLLREDEKHQEVLKKQKQIKRELSKYTTDQLMYEVNRRSGATWFLNK